MADNLMGHVAVITGSTQGIGWAVAQEVANRGVRVVLNGRNLAKSGIAWIDYGRPEWRFSG